MKTEVKMPTININDDTVSLVNWLVTDGDLVTEGQPICEVETSKAIEEVLSPSSGFLMICRVPGDVSTGTTIAYLTPSQTSAIVVEPRATSRLTAEPPPAESEPEEIRFTKAALALMAEMNIPETVFHGRVLIRSADVVAYHAKTAGPTPSAEGPVTVLKPQNENHLSPSRRRGELRRAHSHQVPHGQQIHSTQDVRSSTPITRRKQEEIRTLTEGHLHALPSVLTQIVDVTGLQLYLASLSDDVTITMSSIVTYEVARLLTVFKEFNAAYVNESVAYHEQINIGMAIDGQSGLKVAAVGQANEKTVKEIAAEMESLLQLYAEDRLPVAALTSATFNISDLTTFSVPWFTPLISRNQSAILGLGLLQFDDRELLSLTLTFDHRVTEGKRAAEFLKELKSRVLSYVAATRQLKQPSPESQAQCLACTRCLRNADELLGDAKFLLQVIDVNGKQVLMCKSCIEGW